MKRSKISLVVKLAGKKFRRKNFVATGLGLLVVLGLFVFGRSVQFASLFSRTSPNSQFSSYTLFVEILLVNTMSMMCANKESAFTFPSNCYFMYQIFLTGLITLESYKC